MKPANALALHLFALIGGYWIGLLIATQPSVQHAVFPVLDWIFGVAR